MTSFVGPGVMRVGGYAAAAWAASRGVRPWRAECGLRVLSPCVGQRSAKTCPSATVENSSVAEELVTEPAVVDVVERSSYDSVKQFCHGDPGSIYAVVVPLALLQRLRAWEMNSGPLSMRMNAGAE